MKLKSSSFSMNNVKVTRNIFWKVNLCSRLKIDNYPDPSIAWIACVSHRPNFHSDSSGWEILPPLPSHAEPRLMRGEGWAGGGGAQGSRLAWRVFQRSLSLTLTSLDSLWVWLSASYRDLNVWLPSFGNWVISKISQHFATLDFDRSGWPRLARSSR